MLESLGDWKDSRVLCEEINEQEKLLSNEIENYIISQDAKEKAKQKIGWIISGSIIVSIILLILLGTIWGTLIEPALSYNKANQLVKKGEYFEAINAPNKAHNT